MAPQAQGLLALLDSEDTEPIVVCGCAPLRQKPVEPAGQAFWDRFEDCGDAARSPERSSEKAKDADSDEQEERKSPDSKKKKKKTKDQEALKLPECLKGEDLYALLEIDSGASQDDIKKAWRKICLTAHPDKHGDKSGEELEAVNLNFVKLQEAFNVLSDVKKRRKYDSMGDFDERVPSKLKEGQDFYEVFAEVFRRNAKWSERKPVPDLGDADTPFEKVKAFYEFWFEFESWRDLDEMIIEQEGEDCFQDLEEAECREEKRWMERENARLRGKYQKVERQRLFFLTETAEKLDPRVKADRDRQFAARDAAKAAKEAQRLEAERQAREEAERKAAEEEKVREAQRIEKARLEKEKQAKKTARAKLRKLVTNLNLGIIEYQLQDFLLALDMDEISSLTEALSNGATGEAVFTSMKSKGFEAIIVPRKANEDEKSTEAGSGGLSEEETIDPEEAKRIAKEQEEKRKQQEKRKKKEDEAAAKVRAEEEVKKAVEKEARDLKKKAEQEKRDREQQKANKKEAERLKREEEKKIKDEEKAAEKARLEKEANRKQAEEQRQRTLAAKAEEESAKSLEARTVEFERDRLARADAFEKLEWADVVEVAKAALEDPIVAAGLASAQAYLEPEDLLDAQLACLGSFFSLAVRPDANQLQLSSGLRNKVKKIRTRIRGAAASGELPVTATVEAAADDAILEQFEAAARGEGPQPNAKVEAAPEVPEEAAPQKSKKKAKAKAPAADEDLDDLLAEFGMTPTETKSKKSGKKK